MAESHPHITPDVQGATNEEMVFALRRIARSFALYSKQLEKHTGLTASQLLLLKIVSGNRNRSISDIARLLNLSQATVTGIIKRLESRALINKTRDESDRRRMMIELTDTGRQLLKKAPPLMQEAFVDRFTGLEPWERAMILSSLQRLANLMDSDTVSPAARA